MNAQTIAFLFVVCQMLRSFNQSHFILAERLNQSTSLQETLSKMMSKSYDHSKSDMLVFKIVGADAVDWCPESNHALQDITDVTTEHVIHPAVICANTYSRLVKMAMCLNSRVTLGLFNSSNKSSSKQGTSVEMNLKKMVELLQMAASQQFRPIHNGRHDLIRVVSFNLLHLGKVKTAQFWWRLGSPKNVRNIGVHNSGKAGNVSKSCPQAFQTAVPFLLQQDEDDASAAVLDLLSEISHLRSSFSSEMAIRECMMTEARVHLLRKGFDYALHTLQALLARNKGAGDAIAMESVCLLNHAREALLVWDGYEEHYARLSIVLSALFRSDAPYACQCISPFSALSSPLSTADMLNVAASAARRELARLADGQLAEGAWYRTRPATLLAAPPGAPGADTPRLRVGYLTSEFGDNSVGREMAAVAAAHDQERVAVACFFLSPPDGPGPAGPAAGKRDSAEEWRRRMARYARHDPGL
jgi:hypothetical protein